MRFGVCCGSDKFEFIRKAGYDYGEMCLNQIADMDEAAFGRTRDEVEKSGILAETFNCFFGGVRLTGPGVDYAGLADYADKALERAALLGGKVAVLGSGGARRIPEGFDPTVAGAQFLRVLQLCGEAALRHGMEIALEPLNQLETNIVNTVSAGAGFVEAAQCPGARLLVDFYHLFRENEPPENVIAAGKYLSHVHLARPSADRKMPVEEDMPTVRLWAETLKKAGYDGRLSLEGRMDDFDREVVETRPRLEVFR